jgi:hypothetical protein
LGTQNYGRVIKTNAGITVQIRNIARTVALIGQRYRCVIETDTGIVIEIRIARVPVTVVIIVFLCVARVGPQKGAVWYVRAIVKGVRHAVAISIGRYARKRAERQAECEEHRASDYDQISCHSIFSSRYFHHRGAVRLMHSQPQLAHPITKPSLRSNHFLLRDVFF